MAVVVEGERDARAAQHLLHEQEVAAGVLDGSEQRVHDGARGVVDGEQQGEARAALLEPGVVAAVELEQHPRPWHALAPHVGRLRARSSCSSSSSVRWVWLAPG